MKKRILSIMVVIAMCFSMLSTHVSAMEDPSTNGLCEHHPEYAAECGYTEDAVETSCAFMCQVCNLSNTCEEELQDGTTGSDNLSTESTADCFESEAIVSDDTDMLAKAVKIAPAANQEKAKEAVPYIDYSWDGQILTQTQGSVTDYTEISGSTTAWSEGWYVVKNDVTISGHVSVTGNVHLILTDGYCLNVEKGIKVNEGNSLTVYAQSEDKTTMGELITNGSTAYAGIGGGDFYNVGTITIDGGTVTATGGDRAAGIGGGDENSGGKITINGGDVTAKGSGYGAGIGGGNKGGGGTIAINDGTVTAEGGNFGAGIGGGYKGNSGAITISGGTVNTKGGNFGAGIGGGNNGSSNVITISGGTVEAQGGTGSAGIGGGSKGSGGTIEISGGTITANGGKNGAGIGGGQNGNHGTFSTGQNGNSVIFATGGIGGKSISDDTNKTGWSGVVFEGSNGKLYGTNIILSDDLEIPADKKLIISEGSTLTITEDVTLTNNGTIINHGTIIDNGAIVNNGTITDDGVITGDGTVSGDGNSPTIIYSVTVCATEGGTASGSGSYEKDDSVTVIATADEGYHFIKWTEKELEVSADASYTFPITKNRTLMAVFEKDKEDIPTLPATPSIYPPIVEKPKEGGDVVISPSSPGRGDRVTITPKPDAGYEVDKVTVTDQNGNPVAITKNPDGTYSFIQPDSTVKIQIRYQLIWENPFIDVSKGTWYYGAVRYAFVNKLMAGYGGRRFGPNNNLTRAQLVQILYNKENRPAWNRLLEFEDVSDGVWYTEAIHWATAQGIVSGYGNGTFGPNSSITREQLVAILWRYAGYPEATKRDLHFTDTDKISRYAREAMCWEVENGIISGYGNGELGPGRRATRAQAAQMLKNFFENQ